MLKRREILGLPIVIAVGDVLAAGAEPAKSGVPPKAEYETTSLRGKIVWLGEALAKRFEVAIDPDAAKFDVCLEAADGTLTPIVKDFRGRGYFIDPKLRDFDWELLVRKFPGSPFVQIVRAYVWREGKKYEFDYWCDICAIPMYELKECECCQGPIRFRFREVEDPKP